MKQKKCASGAHGVNAAGGGKCGLTRANTARMNPGRTSSEFETAVFLPATGAGALLDLSADDVEVVAADAAEGGAPAFPFKAGVIATVIIQPEAEEEHGDKQAVNDGGDLQAHGEGFEEGGTAGEGPARNADGGVATFGF